MTPRDSGPLSQTDRHDRPYIMMELMDRPVRNRKYRDLKKVTCVNGKMISIYQGPGVRALRVQRYMKKVQEALHLTDRIFKSPRTQCCDTSPVSHADMRVEADIHVCEAGDADHDRLQSVMKSQSAPAITEERGEG